MRYDVAKKIQNQWKVLLFVMGVMLASTGARAQDVSFDFFYDQLSPFGDWVSDPYYGDVWTPRDIDYNWRPFSDGTWVYTDDNGWMWTSSTPWGWLTFHYGRWFYDYDLERYMWIPGMQWAPAWVTWRYAADYVGWAPMPTWVVHGAGGLRWDWDRYFHECDLYYRYHDRDDAYDRYRGMRNDYFRDRRGFIAVNGDDVRDWDRLDRRVRASSWVFVPTGAFGMPTIRDQIIPIDRNPDILIRTRNASRYEVRSGRIFNYGPDITVIQQRVGRPIRHYKVEDRPHHGERDFGGISGDRVQVYRPRIQRAEFTPDYKQKIKSSGSRERIQQAAKSRPGREREVNRQRDIERKRQQGFTEKPAGAPEQRQREDQQKTRDLQQQQRRDRERESEREQGVTPARPRATPPSDRGAVERGRGEESRPAAPPSDRGAVERSREPRPRATPPSDRGAVERGRGEESRLAAPPSDRGAVERSREPRPRATPPSDRGAVERGRGEETRPAA
ncbi:MAG: DUF6600 domain-containing protein, partial [Candidatus Sumerlaeia bacterium]